MWAALACDTKIDVDVPDRASVEAHIPQAPAKLPRVAFLGDSLAAGMYLAAEQAFPSALQRRLARVGAGFELINAAVSGDTTADALRRVDAVLAHKPRVVVIELGENDATNRAPLDSVEANLRALATKIRSAGAHVLLLGVQLFPNPRDEYASAFEALYPRLAEELQLPFVPSFMRSVAGRPELILADGTHPTPAGHERLAATLVEPLRVLLSPEP